MPYFRVLLHGRGIALAFEDGADPAIGFYCSRDVRAMDSVLAKQLAAARVLEDWRGAGVYAEASRGQVPTLTVEDCSSLGLWSGLFGRRPAGYTFYSREDPP